MTAEHPLAEKRRLLLACAAAYAAALLAAGGTAAALAGHHPLLVTAAADLVATAVVFAFSVGFDNSSLYDPYWSVAPIPIALAWASEPLGTRAWLVLLLLTTWGVRLTGNCLQRWRSLADEDFRYREIRARAGRFYWPASFLAIHLIPTGWVFLGLLPIFPALAGPGAPLGWLDLAAALVTGSAITIEGTADLQLRRFLVFRRDPDAVLDTGLWALSRHPNYLGEVLFWWGLFLFGLAAGLGRGWGWTVAGPLAITALFVFVSVPWMDRRMLAHHPAWAERLRRVPALLPFPRPRG
jgi:steroid 5-alpha reductase family enzyme